MPRSGPAAALLLAPAAAAAARECGNTTTYCPDADTCCDAQYSPTKFGCLLAGDCCKPGPPLPPSVDLPNCLVVGDSVSIGYSANATKLLAGTCRLQHGPWDVADGGAGSTAIGEACLDNFVRTQAQAEVRWDAVLFNFGLHDIGNQSAGHPPDLAGYRRQLTNITQRLAATGATLIYATTTPFMPYATAGDNVVDQLNDIALDVVALYNASVLDLNRLVHDHCGALYQDCDWCRRSPCSYHYNWEGMTAQAHAVAEAFTAALRAA